MNTALLTPLGLMSDLKAANTSFWVVIGIVAVAAVAVTVLGDWARAGRARAFVALIAGAILVTLVLALPNAPAKVQDTYTEVTSGQNGS